VPKLPVVSGLEVVKALSKIGYDADHQTGSHIILRQKDIRTEGLQCQTRKKYLKARSEQSYDKVG